MPVNFLSFMNKVEGIISSVTAERETKGPGDWELSQGHWMSQLERNLRTRLHLSKAGCVGTSAQGDRAFHPVPRRPPSAPFLGVQRAPET